MSTRDYCISLVQNAVRSVLQQAISNAAALNINPGCLLRRLWYNITKRYILNAICLILLVFANSYSAFWRGSQCRAMISSGSSRA
jgi:hypothetical protein